MSNQTQSFGITQQEKQLGIKVGKVYLKVLKLTLALFIISLILSGVAVAQADPRINHVQLKPGDSQFLSSFYAENGEHFQFAFAIEQENGQDYQYNQEDIEGPVEISNYLENMEWLVTLQVYRSNSLDFTNSEKVIDISGEANIIQQDLQEGFYKVKLTNNSDKTLDIVVSRTSANIGFVIAAIVSWIIFGMLVGLFSLMIHFGFWILFFYLIYKIITMSNSQSLYKEQPSGEIRGQIINAPGPYNE